MVIEEVKYEKFIIMTNPDISVIMPVYNRADSLQLSVESILNQTFKNFELLLINDGSSDNSGEVCEKYAKKDARVKVVHQSNGGVGRARNSGLEKQQENMLHFATVMIMSFQMHWIQCIGKLVIATYLYVVCLNKD